MAEEYQYLSSVVNEYLTKVRVMEERGRAGPVENVQMPAATISLGVGRHYPSASLQYRKWVCCH